MNETNKQQPIEVEYVPVVSSDNLVLTPTIEHLAAQIDNAAAEVYAKVARFGDEYKAKEASAQAFKTAGYKGDVGTQISGFAMAAGITNKQAADTILAQSAQFHTALDAIGNLRMQKFVIKQMTDIDAASAQVAGIVSQIRAIGEQL